MCFAAAPVHISKLTYMNTTTRLQLVRWFWPLCHPLITDNGPLVGHYHITHTCLHSTPSIETITIYCKSMKLL